MAHRTISVCVITYNQQEYLKECLDSIFKQICDFEFEVIVGDDCSTDGTADIVRDFCARYPNKLKAHFREKNVGAKANLLSVLRQATGDYIALCEGDDYWTSPFKLQEQHEFLERDPDCALVHSNVFISKRILGKWRVRAAKKVVPSGDIRSELWSGWFNVHTATILFRRKVLDTYLQPEVFRDDLLSGDWPLVFCAAQIGRVAYIDKCLAAYRHAPGSIMRSGDAQKIRLISERLIWWDVFSKRFDFKVPEQTISSVAQASMRQIGYSKSANQRGIHLQGIGYFSKSLHGAITTTLKHLASTILFALQSSVIAKRV